MTRKTVFGPGELNTAQRQHIPQRRAHDGRDDAEGGEQEVEDSVQTGRPTDGLTLSYPRVATAAETVDDSSTSPAVENMTSPSVGNWSHSDALSPASGVAPSVSSVAQSTMDFGRQPRRKRVRTSSDPESTLSADDGGERKVDLAGLLNPIDERPTYSPRLRIADLDNPHSHLAADPRRVNYATESTSLSVRLGSGSHFVQIQPRPPRPPGQDAQNDGTSPTQANDGDELRRKGRRGPLESDQRRQEVLEVRGMGACLRCHIMRIRCTASVDEACANCKETLPKSRKWCIPCTREWPRKRWQHLIPAMLQKYYDPDNCVPDYPPAWLGDVFQLPQTHWSSFTISLEARAVRLPPDRKHELEVHLFITQREGSNVERVLKKDPGWEFVPRMKAGLATYNQTVQMLIAALDAQREVVQRRWVADFIRPDAGQQWVREVLQLNLYFCREVMTTKAIKAASLTLFVRHLMNTPFYIPDERLTEINNELFPEDRRSWRELEEMKARDDAAVARPVNELLKKALAKVLEKLLPSHFQELETLFRLQENGADQAKLSSLDRDEVFCVLILTFVLVATMQTWLLQHAISRDKPLEDNEKHFKKEAKEAIQSMETNIVDFFLALYKYRFYRADMKAQVSPDRLDDARKAASFDLFAQFETVRLRYEDSVENVKHELDLSEEHEQQLLSKNHTRLLLRLNDSIWRPKSKR